jgi:predicted amidohydrolase YtcJ
MWSMVNRKSASGRSLDRSQAVTAREALVAYTVLGAWSGREEAQKGSLAPGKLADLVVLDRDLFAIDPDDIRNVRPVMTFVGGRLSFSS